MKRIHTACPAKSTSPEAQRKKNIETLDPCAPTSDRVHANTFSLGATLTLVFKNCENNNF